MARDPREAWAKLQQTLASAQQQGRRGMGGGNPRNLFGGAAGVLLLVGGVLVVNNALFNGMFPIILACIVLIQCCLRLSSAFA